MQFELFDSKDNFLIDSYSDQTLKLDIQTILNWRNRIYSYQKKIFANLKNSISEASLIPQDQLMNSNEINPLTLKSFSINFWRSNKSISKGPAMYFVMDTIEESKIIVYIGETHCADQRWKGYHDCKMYINNYRESLAYNNIESHLDIRFFLDVPKDVKLRRKLEQKLINLWLPPFNKETRNRWSTTFTNN